MVVLLVMILLVTLIFFMFTREVDWMLINCWLDKILLSDFFSPPHLLCIQQ